MHEVQVGLVFGMSHGSGPAGGFVSWDRNVKSPTELTRNLIQRTSMGSNYLLNVTPMDTGALPPEQVAALQGMQSWITSNGAAVYSAGYSDLTNVPSWGKITRKGGKLYLHVFDWPGSGGTLHVSARTPFSVSAARVLGSSQSVAIRQSGDGYDFVPSGSPTNPIATVIEADIDMATSAPQGTGTGLKAEFWNNTAFNGSPSVTRTDATVNYAWRYTGSPAAAIGTDNFSSRWTGSVQPRYSEKYTFTTVSDDVVRLWINDQLIIDNASGPYPAINRGSINLSAGKRYNIRLKQVEYGGEAYAKLIWISPSLDPQIVPQSQLYPYDTQTGTVRGVASGRCMDTAMATPTSCATVVFATHHRWHSSGAVEIRLVPIIVS